MSEEFSNPTPDPQPSPIREGMFQVTLEVLDRLRMMDSPEALVEYLDLSADDLQDFLSSTELFEEEEETLNGLLRAAKEREAYLLSENPVGWLIPAAHSLDDRREEPQLLPDDRDQLGLSLRADSQFEPLLSFENFVVGDSSEFAHAAALAVAEKPSGAYNPLFIYGDVGLGKTHLLQAIGQGVLRRHPRLNVRYLHAEQFVNELINSIRFDRMPAFRERYRTIDVLLVDDIQFLANKERIQEEFFHTFNTLYTSQKQIILSSDSSPRQIPTLEERLRSRFEWGLIADIQPPEHGTRVRILRRKAELAHISLQEDVASFIADQAQSSVRDLVGLLYRVIAFAALTKAPITLDVARKTLKDILPPTGHRIAGPDIVRLVAHHYGLKVREIRSSSRATRTVFPRQLAMYLCHELTDLSLSEIGERLGDRHRTTVSYAIKEIEQLREESREFARLITKISNQLQQAP